VSNQIVITLTLPEGVVADVDYRTVATGGGVVMAPQAPQSNAAPSCPAHGPMTHKAGTNKAGKPYSGFFCFADGCETTPVWDPKR
jgi:hypothetical protein